MGKVDRDDPNWVLARFKIPVETGILDVELAFPVDKYDGMAVFEAFERRLGVVQPEPEWPQSPF